MSTTSYRTATAGSQWPPSYNSTTAAIGANTDRSIGQPPDFDPPTPPTSRPWSPPVPRSEISTQPWPFSDGGGTTIVDRTVKKRSSATKWFLAGIVVALLIIIAILGGVFGSRLATQNSSRYLFPTLFGLATRCSSIRVARMALLGVTQVMNPEEPSARENQLPFPTLQAAVAIQAETQRLLPQPVAPFLSPQLHGPALTLAHQTPRQPSNPIPSVKAISAPLSSPLRSTLRLPPPSSSASGKTTRYGTAPPTARSGSLTGNHWAVT